MSAGEVIPERTLEEDYQPGTVDIEDYQPGADDVEEYQLGPELHKLRSADVDRSVASSVILDEMDYVEGPEVFRLDGKRASVSQGPEHRDLYKRTLSELEDKPSDEDILDAFAARIAFGDTDHHLGNYVASDSSIVPIDFEANSRPVTSVSRAERYLKYMKDRSGDAPEIDIDEGTRPYLVSRAQELAESVDLDMVKTRLRTRYDLHRDSIDEEPEDLPDGAQYRIDQVKMTRNLEEHI